VLSRKTRYPVAAQRIMHMIMSIENPVTFTHRLIIVLFFSDPLTMKAVCWHAIAVDTIHNPMKTEGCTRGLL
jgi:hypothetical protein